MYQRQWGGGGRLANGENVRSLPQFQILCWRGGGQNEGHVLLGSLPVQVPLKLNGSALVQLPFIISILIGLKNFQMDCVLNIEVAEPEWWVEVEGNTGGEKKKPSVKCF